MTGFLLLSLDISLGLVTTSILLGFLRLARGPTTADRVVALDMMTVSIIAFCALFAIRVEEPVFLDIAIVLALIGFLATVALARFGERRVERSSPEPAPRISTMAHNSDTGTNPEATE